MLDFHTCKFQLHGMKLQEELSLESALGGIFEKIFGPQQPEKPIPVARVAEHPSRAHSDYEGFIRSRSPVTTLL
jgi:hypothetical protein